MLLEREDIAPITRDKGGPVPLSWAAEHGHIAIVEILEERPSADQTMVMTGPACQTAPTRRLQNQGPSFQSAGTVFTLVATKLGGRRTGINY